MQKAGKYEILKKIGAGGFGIVYEGRDPFIKRRVAIKTCTSEDEDIRQRFFREAEIAGNLQHKNIVTIHDFGFEEGVPYLVQEFLPGEDLSQLIARRDPVSLGRKLDLLLQTAHGMAFAHNQGVIHRDIKPNNVRVLEDWRVKIMDFGIAKLANVESNLTKEGMTVGTAAYLPPEQIRGDKVGTRADIFSFGVLAYELLTYSRPFDGKTLSTLLYQILSQEPKPLLEVWPEAPPRVAELVAFCLQKDPAQRCPTFEVAEHELEAAIADASVIDATNLIPQQTSAGAAQNTAARLALIAEERTELLRVGDKVRRAIEAGDLTAAELELTLAEKGRKKTGAFEEIVGPLREELSEARGRQEAVRRGAEKLRLLLGRGVERLDAGRFAEARVAFEAALDVDPGSSEGSEGISRADAGLAWLAAEAVRAAQAAELMRWGAELLARGDASAAATRAREALGLQGESVEAASLLAAAEEQIRTVAAAEELRRAEELRALAAAEEERRQAALEAERQRRRVEEGAERQRRHAEEAAAHERRRIDEAAEREQRERAEAAEQERRRLDALAQEESRLEAAAAAHARRLQELAAEIEGLLTRGALGKAEKLLAKSERELGAEVWTAWRERLGADRAALEAAEEGEREAKRAAAAEATRAKEEQRTRAASAKADLARARSLEASTGGQIQSASFASAKLTDPQTLKWVAAAAAGMAVVALGIWLTLGRRSQDPAATSHAAAPVEQAALPAPATSASRSALEAPSEPVKARAIEPAPVAAEVQIEAPAETGVETPAGPSPLDLALKAAHERLAAGDRRGALSALVQAQRLAPADPTALALLGELRQSAEREVAAARQRALSAGADRLSVETLRDAERAASRMTSAAAPAAAVEAAWRATELFGEAATEASARLQQQRATAAVAVAPALAPAANPVKADPRPPSPAATPPAAPPVAVSALSVPEPKRESAARAADPLADDSPAAIRATLERFRSAYEALDATALAAVWTLDDAATSQIARAFAGYNSLSMLFEKCAVEVAGDAATARCKVSQRIDVKVGSAIKSNQDVTFELRRRSGNWQIVSRTAR